MQMFVSVEVSGQFLLLPTCLSPWPISALASIGDAISAGDIKYSIESPQRKLYLQLPSIIEAWLSDVWEAGGSRLAGFIA